MNNRSIVACVCVLFCVGMMSMGCKKGCGACRAYGLSSGANETYNGYSQPTVQGYTSQVCQNNFCTCQNGFEGDSCQIFSINKYILPSPNWDVSDACSGNPIYSVYMQTSSANPYTTFYISGFFNSGGQLLVYVSSSPNNQSTLTVPAQSLPTGTINSPATALYQNIGGLGKITMTLDYTPNSTGYEEECTVTLTQIL